VILYFHDLICPCMCVAVDRLHSDGVVSGITLDTWRQYVCIFNEEQDIFCKHTEYFSNFVSINIPVQYMLCKECALESNLDQYFVWNYWNIRFLHFISLHVFSMCLKPDFIIFIILLIVNPLKFTALWVKINN